MNVIKNMKNEWKSYKILKHSKLRDIFLKFKKPSTPSVSLFPKQFRKANDVSRDQFDFLIGLSLVAEI